MTEMNGDKVGVMEVESVGDDRGRGTAEPSDRGSPAGATPLVPPRRDAEGASPVNGSPMSKQTLDNSPPQGHTPPTPEAEGNETLNGKKKKHRRGKHKAGRHHRKWKPYSKMSWDERAVVDERETQRACLKREQRMASGQPMAPYNTTQFLMEQHQPQDADFHLDEGGRPRAPTRGEGSGSVESSDEYYDSPEDEEIFLEKDFTEAYENYHAERLQTMDKEELVREYLELEGKVERLESRLKEVGGCRRRTGSAGSPGRPGIGAEQAVDISQATSLEAEIRRLKDANVRLLAENERLKSSIEGASNIG